MHELTHLFTLCLSLMSKIPHRKPSALSYTRLYEHIYLQYLSLMSKRPHLKPSALSFSLSLSHIHMPISLSYLFAHSIKLIHKRWHCKLQTYSLSFTHMYTWWYLYWLIYSITLISRRYSKAQNHVRSFSFIYKPEWWWESSQSNQEGNNREPYNRHDILHIHTGVQQTWHSISHVSLTLPQKSN